MRVPGIYENLPFDDYLAIDAASNSRLGDMKRSPAYCLHRQKHPSTESEWMKLGSAVHCALLEPDSFRDRYHRRPVVLKADGVTAWSVTAKAYKEKAAELEARGLTLLKDDQFEMAESIRDTVRGAAAGQAILEKLTHTELSVVANVNDRHHVFRTVKVRPDLVCAEAGILVEFKTTTDGSPRAFSRTIHNYSYHRAAALYTDALAASDLGAEIKHHVFIVTESEAPYLTRFYSLSESALKVGREEYQRLLAEYAACEESGVWPGPAETVQPIDLPIYPYNQHEEEHHAS